jgi:hypothetical protein
VLPAAAGAAMTGFLPRLAAIAATILVSAPARSESNHVNHLPASLERKVEALTVTLQTRGYEVGRGYWKLFDVDQCKWAIQVYGNCYGNNPTAPYVLPVVPRWRDEYVDRTAHLAFGPLQRGYVGSYRLSEREALVVLAKLPPPGAYFGLQTYVFTRKGEINPEDAAYRRVSANAPEMLPLLFSTAPDESRVVVFSSIGNSINDAVIERQTSEAAWNEERFFVITSDASMAQAVSDALGDATGVPAEQVFVEPVARDLVRLGPQRDADDLLTLVRYAQPTDESAGSLWREALPLAVLRVRDMAGGDADQPYDVPRYEDRSASSEQDLLPSLLRLVKAVVEDWGATAPSCVKPFIVPYLDIDLVGQHCLARPMNCLGDTQDTDSYRISPPFTLDPPGNTVAVVGSLATATGNATYVSLAVNRMAVLEAVMNRSQRELAGSAAAFGVPSADKFYVVYLSRTCPPGLRAPCIEVADDAVPTGEVIKLMQRNYMNPGTQRGPDPGTPDDLSTVEDERVGHELLLRPMLIRLGSGPCQ